MIPGGILPKYSTIMLILLFACIGVIALIVCGIELITYMMEHIKWKK